MLEHQPGRLILVSHSLILVAVFCVRLFVFRSLFSNLGKAVSGFPSG